MCVYVCVCGGGGGGGMNREGKQNIYKNRKCGLGGICAFVPSGFTYPTVSQRDNGKDITHGMAYMYKSLI